MLWIAFAIVFLVWLFFLKNKSVFKNETGQRQGLVYSNQIIGDLVNKDKDGDGVPDWEESLWGTDPTKRETTSGTPDNIAVEKLKAEQKNSEKIGQNNDNQNTENLTETDKFARELFATITSLNQNGAMDQATADKISSSLAEKIKNSPAKKVFILADLKVSKSDITLAARNYNNALDNIHKKYPVNTNIVEVLKKFLADQNNADTNVPLELDPIIKQMKGIIGAMVKISVPQSLAPLHLNFINSFQALLENLDDIRLYDTDAIVALGAISQYDQNTTKVEASALKLSDAIEQKLKN